MRQSNLKARCPTSKRAICSKKRWIIIWHCLNTRPVEVAPLLEKIIYYPDFNRRKKKSSLFCKIFRETSIRKRKGERDKVSLSFVNFHFP